MQPNYDGFGRLRSVSVNNGASVWKYRWAGNQILSEYDDTDGTWEIEDSKLIYTYVHDPAMVAGAPLADLAGTNPSTGTARYYFGDNLGSTRRLRNASKTSLGLYEYQPYGEMYAESGATPKYKFAGMYYSPDLAYYYTLNRFYNPTLARWTTRDPLGMVDGPNVYGYVEEDPTSVVDPLGESAEALCMGWGLSTRVIGGWTIAVAEPTPVGECVMGVLTIGTAVYELYKLCFAEHRQHRTKAHKNEHEKKRPGAPEKKDEKSKRRPRHRPRTEGSSSDGTSSGGGAMGASGPGRGPSFSGGGSAPGGWPFPPYPGSGDS